MKRLLTLIAVGLTVVLAAAACGSSKSPLSSGGGSKKIVIGSANFPENVILADIYADVLKGKGFSVSTRLNIGARELYFKLLKKGSLTVFPEYNGALLGYLNPKSSAASTSAVDAALKKALPSNLEILKPAAAQDNDSVTVTKATAARYHLKTIANIKPYESKFTFGGPPEFKTREQGLIGLRQKYGLKFKGFDALDEAGPLTIAALKQGKVQAADVFTTDPSIIEDHFVVLQDPKHVFPVQNVTPVVAKSVASSKLVAALNAVSAKLSTADLLRLDDQVEAKHDSAAAVAAAFVSNEGL